MGALLHRDLTETSSSLDTWLQSWNERGRERIEAVADRGGRLAAAPPGRAAGRGRVRGGRAGARPRVLGGGGALHPRARAGPLARERRRSDPRQTLRAPPLRAGGHPPRGRLGRLPLPDSRRPARPRARRGDLVLPAGGRPARAPIGDHGLPAEAGRPAGAPGLDRGALRARAGPGSRRGRPPLLRPARTGRAVRAVVFGASGVIGSALLTALRREHDVVAVSRRPRSPEPGVTWAVADVTDGGQVAAALAGADVVYYLVHSLGSADFEERDALAAAVVAREAEEAGVHQIVYLGGLGDDSPDLSPHLRSRRETGERLKSGTVPVTTLRAAMVVGKGSAAFETIVALVDRLPGMITPRWVSTPTQPIALRDMVRFLAGVAGRQEAFGETFYVGGSEVMTYCEMIERIVRIRGRRPLIVEVPVLSPRLSSLWLHLVTPVKASVARPLVEGLRTPTVAEDDRIRALVPFKLTPFDEAAREALG